MLTPVVCVAIQGNAFSGFPFAKGVGTSTNGIPASFFLTDLLHIALVHDKAQFTGQIGNKARIVILHGDGNSKPFCGCLVKVRRIYTGRIHKIGRHTLDGEKNIFSGKLIAVVELNS